MPVYPPSWEPLAPTGRYRHMARRDGEVWERWLRANRDRWDAVAYDVAMGGVVPALEQLGDAERLGFQYSSAMKIDALLRRGSTFTICEVKPEATVSAIGAVLCYREMLVRDIPELRDVGLLVVCEFASKDFRYCADRFGVEVQHP